MPCVDCDCDLSGPGPRCVGCSLQRAVAVNRLHGDEEQTTANEALEAAVRRLQGKVQRLRARVRRLERASAHTTPVATRSLTRAQVERAAARDAE